jgi:hypothetical protein
MVRIAPLLLAAILALPVAANSAEHASPSAINAGKGWHEIAVDAKAVPLNAPDVPAPGVTFMGALALTTDSIDRMHGLSDLKFTSDKDFLSVSDEGWLMSGRVVLDPAGRLIGVEKGRIEPLLGETGDRLFDRPRRREDNYDTWADSEGLAVLSRGRYLVSFEHHQRVWMYGVDKRGDDLPRAMISPPFAIDYNAGPEAVASDGKGGYYAAMESGGVWHCAKDRCLPIAAPPEPPLSAAAQLRVTSLDRDPLGRGLFVLERAFDRTTGNTMRISLWRDPDSNVFDTKETVLELKDPAAIDNMEGLAAVKRGKAVRLYVISDDNFSPTQRTLLMAFDYRP